LLEARANRLASQRHTKDRAQGQGQAAAAGKGKGKGKVCGRSERVEGGKDGGAAGKVNGGPLLRVAGSLAVTRALGDMYLKHRR
jgi:hypothetical protein